MTYSIYHFFADLSEKKEEFLAENKLESFPFDKLMLSCINKGIFPDLVIKLNNNEEQFTGGEQSQQHDKMKIAFQEKECEKLFSQMEVLILQHHFNGKFLVFQSQLST